MEQFTEQVAHDVMARVVRRRKARGWSAAKLAEACTEAGHPLTRAVIAGMESGRRSTLNVADLLAFAHVLEVPVLELLYGVDALDRPSPLALPVGTETTAAELLLRAQAADGGGFGWTPLEAVRALASTEACLVEDAADVQAPGPVPPLMEEHLVMEARAAAETRWAFLEAGIRPPGMGERTREAYYVAGFAPVLELLLADPVEGDPTPRRRTFRQALERVAPRHGRSGLGRGVGYLFERGDDDGDA